MSHKSVLVPLYGAFAVCFDAHMVAPWVYEMVEGKWLARCPATTNEIELAGHLQKQETKMVIRGSVAR